jgi:hypothetical protein
MARHGREELSEDVWMKLAFFLNFSHVRVGLRWDTWRLQEAEDRVFRSSGDAQHDPYSIHEDKIYLG